MRRFNVHVVLSFDADSPSPETVLGRIEAVIGTAVHARAVHETSNEHGLRIHSRFVVERIEGVTPDTRL